MRKIIGTIGATLAIAAITGALLSPPKNLPLGDGVDRADRASAGGVQGHSTMDTYASFVQVPEGEVTGDGRPISGPRAASLVEFSTSADEQRTQFVGDFNPSVDKIRVTSDAGLNHRLNVDEGTVLLAGNGSLNPGMPQVVGSAYQNYADVDSDGMGDESQDPDGGGLGLDWEDDWFDDSEAGDELDEDIFDDTSAARLWSALEGSVIALSTWSTMGTRSGGEVITLD